MLSAALSLGFATGVSARGRAPDPCTPAQASWPEALARFDSEPVDLRFLNDAPAGRHGFVRARGEALEFADGAPARFWGANVAAEAIFESSDAEIDRHAERIAKLGFNLVRLHHHDSTFWVRHSLLDASGDDSLRSDPVGFAKLDRWVAKLRRQGVYIWLDLHTGRVFKRGDDIPGFDEIARQKARAKGFLYLNPRLEALVAKFAADLLAHRNPHTGLRYREDPALVGVLVTNENDLVHHFGNLFTKKAANPWHRERFLEAAAVFSQRTGRPLRSLERTWTPGAAKLLLADLEHSFGERVRMGLRAQGVRVPIAITSYWGGASLAALAPLSSGEWIDVHSYGRGNPLEADPRRFGGFVARIAGAQLVDRPLVVSEWNLSQPLDPQRFLAPLWVASIAAFQGWDALMLYAYAQRRLGARQAQSPFSSGADPALLGLMPAASLLYRRGDVAAARTRTVIAPSRAAVWDELRQPEGSPAIGTRMERVRVAFALPAVKELPWLESSVPEGDERITDLDSNALAPGAPETHSDTGELSRNFIAGFHRVDTPRTQAAAGRLAGRTLELSRLRLALATDAAIALSSLDGEPIERSAKVLVTAVARSCPLGDGYRSEPVMGTAELRSERTLALVPLGAAGERGALRLLEPSGGRVTIPLDFGSPWALLEARD